MDLQFLISSGVEITKWVGTELTIPCVVAIIVTAFYRRYKKKNATSKRKRSNVSKSHVHSDPKRPMAPRGNQNIISASSHSTQVMVNASGDEIIASNQNQSDRAELDPVTVAIPGPSSSRVPMSSTDSELYDVTTTVNRREADNDFSIVSQVKMVPSIQDSHDSLAVNTAVRRYPNFARCSAVVIEVFPKIMQKLLATQIKAVDLHNIVTNHRDFKTILNGNEMYTIQSLKTNGFSKLNFTLIYKILKFNIIKSITHKWGAVPLENEIEIGDDVERMRFARQNLVYRIDCDMQTSEFETFFTDFVQLGKRIDIHLKESKNSGLQRDIEYLKTSLMDDCQQKEYIKAIKDPEYLKVRILQMITEEMHHLSKGSNHLSMYLNEKAISLPIVKLFQNAFRRQNEIREIMCGVLSQSTHAKIVGSKAEGLGLGELGSDLDVMVFAPNFKVFDCIIEPVNIDFKHCHTIRQPDERHPGYSKLRILSLDSRLFEESRDKYIYTDVNDGKDYLKNNVKECIDYTSDLPIDISIHGPAYSCIPTEDHEKTASTFAPLDTKAHHMSDPKYFDFVFGMSSKQWPAEAAEWKTRKRAYNRPTQNLVEDIISTGYVLAGVGSKESKESELQWRISFNEAEQLMIESLNETEIHCLFLLKLLKKMCLFNIAGQNITSYTMKTVMFWCLEETSVDYWQSSNLVGCFFFCVSKLKLFVDGGFLPNYFIRKRNQFVANEFTCDMQTKTRKYLEGFLKNQKDGISLILPSYRENADIIYSPYNCQLCFIRSWIKTQTFVLYSDPFGNGNALSKLYDGYNIQHIYKRCNDTLDKLTNARYKQPLIKKLQNYMGVLQYILYREEKDRMDSDTRGKYCKYMNLDASGDLTHTTLRIATCYLDDGVKEDCISIIRKVTDSDGHLFIKTHHQRVNQTLDCDMKAFSKKSLTAADFEMYKRIIYDIDFVHQDPYRTTDEFEKLKNKGTVLIGYNTFNLVWKRSYFDVTFMVAELPVLPKPAALELCIDFSQKYISFHPFLYGLLLEFLWNHKYCSGNEEKESVLSKMKNCISDLPLDQQSRGLNFIVYCYLLQKDYRSASRYLFRSFELNHVEQNVAFLYIKYIIALLRKALSDDNEDHS